MLQKQFYFELVEPGDLAYFNFANKKWKYCMKVDYSTGSVLLEDALGYSLPINCNDILSLQGALSMAGLGFEFLAGNIDTPGENEVCVVTGMLPGLPGPGAGVYVSGSGDPSIVSHTGEEFSL